MSRKIAYWISTALLCLLYGVSAVFYLTRGDTVRHLFAGLGFPDYLIPILIVAKLAGITAILFRVKVGLSDLAYAGMFYHLLLALSAHLHAHDYAGAPPAVVGLLMLAISFLTQNAARAKQSPYPPRFEPVS